MLHLTGMTSSLLPIGYVILHSDGTWEQYQESASVLYGDVNLDGNVDISDAVLLNKAAAGMVTLNNQAAQECRLQRQW